jgi:hypothetical protein
MMFLHLTLLFDSPLKYLHTHWSNQHTPTMALRRPPTRIELKADDVEEYDKVRDHRKKYIFIDGGDIP